MLGLTPNFWNDNRKTFSNVLGMARGILSKSRMDTLSTSSDIHGLPFAQQTWNFCLITNSFLTNGDMALRCLIKPTSILFCIKSSMISSDGRSKILYPIRGWAILKFVRILLRTRSGWAMVSPILTVPITPFNKQSISLCAVSSQCAICFAIGYRILPASVNSKPFDFLINSEALYSFSNSFTWLDSADCTICNSSEA